MLLLVAFPVLLSLAPKNIYFINSGIAWESGSHSMWEGQGVTEREGPFGLISTRSTAILQ